MEDTQELMKTKEHGENIYKMMNASEAVAKRCKKGVWEILQNSLYQKRDPGTGVFQ